jgi:hypothetical protein
MRAVGGQRRRGPAALDIDDRIAENSHDATAERVASTAGGAALMVGAPGLGCGGGLVPLLELQTVKLGVDAVVV